MAKATQIKIINGRYRHHTIQDKTFPMVKPLKTSELPGESFVTVLAKQEDGLIAEPNLPQKKIRVKVNSAADFQYLDAEGQVATSIYAAAPAATGAMKGMDDEESTVIQNYIQTETEEEAAERIEDTFGKLEKLTHAVTEGIIKGLIVSGPPGIGKSYTVEEILQKANFGNTIAQQKDKFKLIKGGCSAIGLYRALYQNSEKGQVVVFDDCDAVLFDEDCLNLLKAALDTGHTRLICWNTESRVLRQEDIPNSFIFSGSIVFLTNIDFSSNKSGRIANHLRAIMSRCHYLNLEMDCQRDQIIRIKSVMSQNMLEEFDFTQAQCDEILNYVISNQDFLLELSLRMVRKIAELYKAEPNDWRGLVEAGCLKREAKFDRLTKERDEKRKLEQKEIHDIIQKLDERSEAIKKEGRKRKKK